MASKAWHARNELSRRQVPSQIQEHPRLKKFLHEDKKDAFSKLRQIEKVFKEDGNYICRCFVNTFYDEIFKLIQKGLAALDLRVKKEAAAKKGGVKNFFAGFNKKRVKMEDVDTIIWSIEKLVEFEQERLRHGWELETWQLMFKRLLFFYHRQSYRRGVYKILVVFVEALFPRNPGKNSAESQVELLCLLHLLPGKSIHRDDGAEGRADSPPSREKLYAALKTFQEENIGEGFFNYASKRLAISGKDVVEIQNLVNNDSKDATIPTRGYIGMLEVDSIIASCERITPFITLMLGALDYSVWVINKKRSNRSTIGNRNLLSVELSKDGSLEKEKKLFFNTEISAEAMGLDTGHGYPHMFLVPVEALEKPSEENTQKMLVHLYDYVLACNNPDRLQLWYGFIYNHVFARVYPSFVSNSSPYFDSIGTDVQDLNQIDPFLFSYQGTPIELQIATVEFLVSGLRNHTFFRIAFATVDRAQAVLGILGEIMLYKDDERSFEKKSSVLELYTSWFPPPSVEKPELFHDNRENTLDRHIHIIVDQCCTVIECAASITSSGTSQNRPYAQALGLLRVLVRTSQMQKLDFKKNYRRILAAAITLIEQKDNFSTMWSTQYITPVTRLFYEILVLAKCVDIDVWDFIYSNAPTLLDSKSSIKAWGDVMVPITKCMLDQACDQPGRSHNIDVESEVGAGSVSRLSLNSSNKLVSPQRHSFGIAELSSESEDYSTDFWRSFDRTLSIFFPLGRVPEQRTEFDSILLIWDRLLHILSCGEHCIIWRSEEKNELFTLVVLQLVRVIRAWLDCRMSRKMVQSNTPLVSSMLELFCPWLLSACEMPCNAKDLFCFDSGRSVAFSACCIIMGVPNTENINVQRSAEIYSCIGKGLLEGPAVVEGILLHSRNVFSSGQHGVTSLIPLYLSAIDKLTLDPQKYDALRESVRKCVPVLLSSIFLYCFLLGPLPSQPLVGELKSIMHKDARPRFKSRGAHAISLLQRALHFEKSSSIRQIILFVFSIVCRYDNCLSKIYLSDVDGGVSSEPEEVPLSLIKILKDDGLRIQLRAFCAKEYSSENVDFWVAVEQFRDRHQHLSENADPAELKRVYEQGKLIFNDFIGAGAPREVNIPSSIASKIQVLPKNSVPMNFFDDAQREVYELMARDTFSRFKTELKEKYSSLNEDIIQIITRIIKDPSEESRVIFPALQLLAQFARSTLRKESSAVTEAKHEAIEQICLSVDRVISNITESRDVPIVAVHSKVLIGMITCLKDWATSCSTSSHSEKRLVNKVLSVLLNVSRENSIAIPKKKNDESKIFFKRENNGVSVDLVEHYQQIVLSAAEALSHILKFHNAPDGVDINRISLDPEKIEDYSNTLHFAFHGKMYSFCGVPKSQSDNVMEQMGKTGRVEVGSTCRIVARDAFGKSSWNFLPCSSDPEVLNDPKFSSFIKYKMCAGNVPNDARATTSSLQDSPLQEKDITPEYLDHKLDWLEVTLGLNGKTSEGGAQN